jgi:hypothetical protein
MLTAYSRFRREVASAGLEIPQISSSRVSGFLALRAPWSGSTRDHGILCGAECRFQNGLSPKPYLLSERRQSPHPACFWHPRLLRSRNAKGAKGTGFGGLARSAYFCFSASAAMVKISGLSPYSRSGGNGWRWRGRVFRQNGARRALGCRVRPCRGWSRVRGNQ